MLKEQLKEANRLWPRFKIGGIPSSQLEEAKMRFPDPHKALNLLKTLRQDPALLNQMALMALRLGDSDLMQEILKNGFNVNEDLSLLEDGIQESVSTPLQFAVLYRHPKIMELLLKNGAQVNARDGQGRTPLHLVYLGEEQSTCEELVRQSDTISLLVKNQADVDASDYQGKTPVDYLVNYAIDMNSSLLPSAILMKHLNRYVTDNNINFLYENLFHNIKYARIGTDEMRLLLMLKALVNQKKRRDTATPPINESNTFVLNIDELELFFKLVRDNRTDEGKRMRLAITHADHWLAAELAITPNGLKIFLQDTLGNREYIDEVSEAIEEVITDIPHHIEQCKDIQTQYDSTTCAFFAMSNIATAAKNPFPTTFRDDDMSYIQYIAFFNRLGQSHSILNELPQDVRKVCNHKNETFEEVFNRNFVETEQGRRNLGAFQKYKRNLQRALDWSNTGNLEQTAHLLRGRQGFDKIGGRLGELYQAICDYDINKFTQCVTRDKKLAIDHADTLHDLILKYMPKDFSVANLRYNLLPEKIFDEEPALQITKAIRRMPMLLLLLNGTIIDLKKINVSAIHYLYLSNLYQQQLINDLHDYLMAGVEDADYHEKLLSRLRVEIGKPFHSDFDIRNNANDLKMIKDFINQQRNDQLYYRNLIENTLDNRSISKPLFSLQ